jgi:hypothetical protein
MKQVEHTGSEERGGCIGTAVGSNHSKNDLPSLCYLKLNVS